MLDSSRAQHYSTSWRKRAFNIPIPDEVPGYLVRDRDAVYGQVVKRRLRGLGIRDRRIAPSSPWQNAYVERMSGAARRECIDHTIVLGETHLPAYTTYYNKARTHLSLGKGAPISRSIEEFRRIIVEPMVSGCITATLESRYR